MPATTGKSTSETRRAEATKRSSTAARRKKTTQKRGAPKGTSTTKTAKPKATKPKATKRTPQTKGTDGVGRRTARTPGAKGKAKRTKETTTRRETRRTSKRTGNGQPIARRTNGKPVTPAARVAQLLPRSIEQVEYVHRTLEILDEEERRRTRLRQQRNKQLGQVLLDLTGDVRSRIHEVEQSTQRGFEELTERLWETPLGRRAQGAGERVEVLMDTALGWLGLARRSQVQEALPAPRR